MVCRWFTLSVTCAAITVSAPGTHTGTAGVAFSQTFTQAGGIGAMLFTTANTLPNGFTLSGAGVLSGMTVQPGSFPLTVTATDSNGCTGTVNYTLTIGCPALTLSPGSLPNGTAASGYSQSVAVAPAGTYSYAVTNGALPAGLTLNAASGAISGTPTVVGGFNCTITATLTGGAPNSPGLRNPGFRGGTAQSHRLTTPSPLANCSGSQAYTLTINCPAYTFSPATLPNGQAGVAYSQSLSVAPNVGGLHSYTFTGTLPPGLTLSNAGVLNGTPTTAGAYNFNVTVTGSTMFSGCASSKSYSLVVNCPALTLTASLPNGVLGTVYNQMVAASPAGTTYSYALTTNVLPPGLSLNNATGAITGTPTASGNYAFTITATGWGACPKTQSYNVLITGTCGTLTLNPPTLPAGVLGVAYPSQTLMAVGGTAPYAFAVVSGALPLGLTLNSGTGVIGGTPLVSGTASFTIRATGEGGCTSQRVYVLAVNCSKITLTLSKLPNGVQRAAYNQTMTASPTGNYSYSLLLGSLPPGFNLSSAGVLGGVTNQTGTFNFTIKAVNGICQGTKAYTLIVTSSALALAQQADYDGDGQSDFVLWSNDGRWSLLLSKNDSANRQIQSWGAAGDVALLGDYDGDGQTDLAVFRPADGMWHVKRSSDDDVLSKAWGLTTDVPVPGDYDGDGQTDIAVWRGFDSHWYILYSGRSSDEMIEATAWGASYAPYFDVPVPGDYDGDGQTDLAVFRRSTGTWYVKRSTDGQVVVKAWGLGTDVPVAADYDGDGKTDIAVWRGSTWYIWQSASDSAREAVWGAHYAPYFDQAAPGDYDGDGKADIAVWRAAEQTWYIRCDADGSMLTRSLGQVGHAPVSSPPR